jgi:hypothetical protein
MLHAHHGYTYYSLDVSSGKVHLVGLASEVPRPNEEEKAMKNVACFSPSIPSSLTNVTFGESVSCQRCAFSETRKFTAEINLHFPGWEGLTKPTVFVFPEIKVCLSCGFAEFSIAESELRRLAGDDEDLARSQAAE